MTVNILCPGPSLADARPYPVDLTIAVNRAALTFPCDWWAAVDRTLVTKIGGEVKPGPRLLTNAMSLESLTRRKSPWAAGAMTTDSMMGFCPVASWTLRTMTCAMVLAAKLGATAINLYGHDMAGTLDFDGVAAGEMRDVARWDSERVIYGNLVAWLTERGVEIKRHERL